MISTYYVDGHRGISDPGNAWTSDSLGFQKTLPGTNSWATTTTQGTSSSNYLLGRGVDCPLSGGAISQVRVRAGMDTSGAITPAHLGIWTENSGQSLVTAFQVNITGGYTSWFTLTAPTGGWTWDKLKKLEARAWRQNTGSFGSRLTLVQLEVTHTPAVESYDVSNYTGYINMNGVTNILAEAQSFTVTRPWTVTSAQFYLGRADTSAVGTVTARIYSTTGTHGTSAVPTGSPLVISTGVAATTLTTSPTLSMTDFSFTSNNRLTLSPGTYCVAAYYQSSSGDTGIIIGNDSDAPTHSGNLSYYSISSSAWLVPAGMDMVFSVNGFYGEADKMLNIF